MGARAFALITSLALSTLALVGNGMFSASMAHADEVVSRVAVGSRPYGVVTDPSGAHAYVANHASGTVSILDITDGSSVRVSEVVTVGDYPVGLALSRDGRFAYVTNEGSASVSVIDSSTKSVVGAIPVAANPYGIAASPDGKQLYVTHPYSNSVSVIDISTKSVTATIPVGSYPFGVAVTPDASRVLVSNNFSNDLSIIDAGTQTVIGIATVGRQPFGLAIDPAGKIAYVTNQSPGSVSVVDIAGASAVQEIPVGANPVGITVNSDGSRVYVADNRYGDVAVIDTAAGKVLHKTPVGDFPFNVALFADSRFALVTNSGSNDVSVVMLDLLPPAAPGAPVVTAGPNSISITITPPSSGGKPDYYTVHAVDSLESCTVQGPAGSCTINNVTGGRSYTFTSTATNSAGTSLNSPRSSPVLIPHVVFADVPSGNQFHDEITWIGDERISTGWVESDGTRTYRPLNSINRDAMAAFLYRMAGRPSFTEPSASPFADVSPSNLFYKEITWLASTGVSTGWAEENGSRTFRPLQSVNRDAMAAFLYRIAGSPAYEPPIISPFRDATFSSQFYKEISWLASTGVSTGWTEADGTKTYRPLLPVARDAMAAFLYRYSLHAPK